MWTFLLPNGALWDICLVHSEICALGLRKQYFNPWSTSPRYTEGELGHRANSAMISDYHLVAKWRHSNCPTKSVEISRHFEYITKLFKKNDLRGSLIVRFGLDGYLSHSYHYVETAFLCNINIVMLCVIWDPHKLYFRLAVALVVGSWLWLATV